jgi:hypothetical protein
LAAKEAMMGFRVEFTLDGRRVSEAQFGRGMEQKILGIAEDHVRAAVEGTRCTTHGRYARVVAMRKRSGKLEFDVEGCCDDLISRAQRATAG